MRLHRWKFSARARPGRVLCQPASRQRRSADRQRRPRPPCRGRGPVPRGGARTRVSPGLTHRVSGDALPPRHRQQARRYSTATTLELDTSEGLRGMIMAQTDCPRDGRVCVGNAGQRAQDGRAARRHGDDQRIERDRAYLGPTRMIAPERGDGANPHALLLDSDHRASARIVVSNAVMNTPCCESRDVRGRI